MGANELLLITTTVDAYNNQYVTVVDFPGEFITADMYEEFILVIEGVISETVLTILPITYR